MFDKSIIHFFQGRIIHDVVKRCIKNSFKKGFPRRKKINLAHNQCTNFGPPPLICVFEKENCVFEMKDGRGEGGQPRSLNQEEEKIYF